MDLNILDILYEQTRVEKYKHEQELQQMVNDYNNLARMIQEKDKVLHGLIARMLTFEELIRIERENTDSYPAKEESSLYNDVKVLEELNNAREIH